MNVVVYLQTTVPEWNPKEDHFKRLQGRFPDVRFIFPKDPESFVASLGDAEVLFSMVVTGEILPLVPKLKWFHSSGVQYGHLFAPDLFDRVTVTNSKGGYAPLLSKILMDEIVSHSEACSLVLDGATLGVVGLGANGMALAKLAKEKGMNVVAIKRTVEGKPDFVQSLWGPDHIGRLVSDSDVIALTCPLTSETTGLFNSELFENVKKGSILVSSSRPDVIEEGAFLKALESGQIAAASVDSLWPKESPIFECNNVSVMPHVSLGDPGVWERLFDIFAMNLKRYLLNEPLESLMDPDFLY